MPCWTGATIAHSLPGPAVAAGTILAPLRLSIEPARSESRYVPSPVAFRKNGAAPACAGDVAAYPVITGAVPLGDGAKTGTTNAPLATDCRAKQRFASP